MVQVIITKGLRLKQCTNLLLDFCYLVCMGGSIFVFSLKASTTKQKGGEAQKHAAYQLNSISRASQILSYLRLVIMLYIGLVMLYVQAFLKE